MIEKLRERGWFRKGIDEREEREEMSSAVFGELHLVAAQLLLAAGASATLQHLVGRPEREARDRSTAERWAPALVGTLAAAAHAVHARQPSESTEAATRIANGAVLGTGIAETLDSLYATAQGRTPLSTSGLILGTAGVFGFLLGRRERETVKETEALERRARLTERWVPRRRRKLERIVVHV